MSTEIEKGEDRVPDVRDEDASRISHDRTSSLHSIFAWFSRQSLPRLVGLLIGNTRDLEQRLTDKDMEISYLRSQVNKWENQYIAFEDSVLLSKGMKPTTMSVEDQHTRPTSQLNSKFPGESLAVAAEVDRLKDALLHRPGAVEELVKDLEATNTPRTQLILQRFYEEIKSMDDTDYGVTVHV